MTASSVIAQQTIRILRYIDNETLPAVTPAEDDRTIMALQHIHQLFPGCVVITCPSQHGQFFYISDNCENVFGYNTAQMTTRFRNFANYITQMHEADLSDFKDCLSFFEGFMKKQPLQNLHKIRIALHYRFLNADGQYRYMLEEKASLINSAGLPVHYSLIRAMPADAIFNGVKLEIYLQENTMQKILEHRPSLLKKLSSRESELVALLKQGLTTKQIAWQLNISHNTARNIKSKLFEKFSVNNAIELLNRVG